MVKQVEFNQMESVNANLIIYFNYYYWLNKEA